MKHVFRAKRLELILASISLLIVLFLSLFPVEFRTTAPGYNKEVGLFITIEDPYEVEGSFHTTSVIVLNRTTILQRWVGDWENTVDVREYPAYYENIDISDLRVTGALQKDDSLNNSLVVAIDRSAYDITFETFIMVYLTYSNLDPDTLEIGDVILSINGNTDVMSAFADVACDETASFRIERDEIEQTFDVTRHTQTDGSCSFGLLIRSFTEIYDSEVEYTLHESVTTGSSGGLMQALYVFNQLTPNDLTGGLKIAGTGTIDAYGDVGPIGGIRQKIITSALNGMDIFFVPHLSDSEYDNYIVAQAVLAELDSNMILVPVTSIDDAIAYLESRFGGAFDE